MNHIQKLDIDVLNSSQNLVVQGKGYRPSSFGPIFFGFSDEDLLEHTNRVMDMALRYSEGCDIWTGEPLNNKDATEWLEIALDKRSSNKL